MAQDESATATTPAENVTAAGTTEENTLLLDETVSRGDCSRGPIITTGDRVRQRLAVCLFLHIVGVAIVTQVYPRVVLDHFHDDDGKASRFNGWLTLISSILQLIAIPTLCGASDVVGRRAILGGSLALTSMSTLALGLAPNSIVAVSASQLVSCVAGAILPVSQAVIVDLSTWGEAAGGGEVTHGLGLIGAAFGLAISVGPILGGSLSETHRAAACLLSSAMSLASMLSLTFYGWEETAPAGHGGGEGGTIEAAVDAASVNSAGEGGRGGGGEEGDWEWTSFLSKGSTWRIVNPFSVLKIFLENNLLTEMAGVLLCFCFSLNVFCVYYNYLDFRYHWSALDISFFFSTFGLTLALTSGVIIRFLVPRRLSMERGVMVGMFLQAASATSYGLAPRGWILYPVLLLTVLQYITEPCIQGLMATLVDADRQGSLQGAVQSLRILAAGVAGVGYGQIFSLGVSDGFEEAFGFLVPGLPLFCSAGFAVTGLVVAWFALRRLGGASKTQDNSLDEAEQGEVVGGGPNGTATTVLTTPLAVEGNGGLGNAGPAGRDALAAKAAAPADAGALVSAALRPNGVGHGEDAALDDLEPRGGLGDEEDVVESELSVPLLPRGSGVQNGTRQPSS
eukprot:g4668.t1